MLASPLRAARILGLTVTDLACSTGSYTEALGLTVGTGEGPGD